ncbi:MAG TPA: diguanylate cyclase [Rhodocyclaceae bacterium]|nr:diguanylate cyclase [Rhodocyclaceae bacterium]
MDVPKESPSEIAKQTLTRLARERLMPTPENYCRVYRKVEGRFEPWSSVCEHTRLLEEALTSMINSWQDPGLLDGDTGRMTKDLGRQIEKASTNDDLKRIREQSHQLGLRIKRDLASGSELQAELVDIMQLVVSNLGHLSSEDLWLRGQLESMDELLSGSVTSADLSKAKTLLRHVLERQKALQHVMVEAQTALKSVMAELIKQAASLVEDTGGYEHKITDLSQRIQAADDLPAIKDVVSELDHFVRDMGSSVRRSHDSMSSTHTRLIQAEQQIIDLRKNLAETTEKVRRDSLTGSLNRSGLDEIWQREVERAKGDQAHLSIGILDVDNFKHLNDRLGHTAGDEALVHLTSVIRKALHGTDTMARYGGEEFVILLPDTDLAGGEAVMQRLQRELTKHFFLHGNEKLLITFSAGVTAVDLEKDSMLTAIERADSALYQAKHQGKNRVVAV